MRVRNRASEKGLSLLTAGRLKAGTTPSCCRVASIVAPFIGAPLSECSVSALKWTPKTGQQFKLASNQKGHVRMSEAKRKTYTASFKAKVGLEAIRGVKTANEIGQDHGVHPAQVGQSKKEILEQAGTLFETKRGRKREEEQAEPDRLYSEIGRLKMALDWLKKSPG